MNVTFRIIAELTVSEQGQPVKTDITVQPLLPLKAERYVNEDGYPNEEGSYVMRIALTEGLKATLIGRGQMGWTNPAKELREVIESLEQVVTSTVDVYKSHGPDDVEGKGKLQ